MGQINLYTAVEEMKAVSKAEGTFSIKFRKYNRQKQSGGDLVFLKAARLRSKASDEKIENASHKLFLVDSVNDLIVSVSVFYVQEQPEQYKKCSYPCHYI